MKYIIKDNQAGFVLKNGVFQKMITAGTWHFPKIAGYTVVIKEMLGELDYLGFPIRCFPGMLHSLTPLYIRKYRMALWASST